MLLRISRFFLFSFVILVFTKNLNAEDIISVNSGGKVIHWTFEKAPNVAHNIIDTDKDTYWSSGKAVFPQVITFSMPGNKRFEGFSVIAKNANDPTTWAKEIRISSADPFPHMGGWVELVEIELPKDGKETIIKIEPTRGRYFRLEIFSTHGSSPTEVSLSSFSVYNKMEKK